MPPLCYAVCEVIDMNLGENIRRTDLCRHHKFAGGAYIWNWKGGVHDGAATPETRDLYPIPTKVISFQGYKQNKGYN